MHQSSILGHLNMVCTDYQISLADIKRIIAYKFRCDEEDQYVFDPPYVLEGLVSARDFHAVTAYLNTKSIVHGWTAHKTKTSGYRIRAKFCHPSYFYEG